MKEVGQLLVCYCDQSVRWFARNDETIHADYVKFVNRISQKSFERVVAAFTEIDTAPPIGLMRLELEEATFLINAANINEVVMFGRVIGEQPSPDLPGPRAPGNVNDGGR